MLQQQLATARAGRCHRAMEELLWVAVLADVMAANLKLVSSLDSLSAHLQQASTAHSLPLLMHSAG